ncbi:MAG: methylmalonyl Co-A mutase-associated GTPase MeaB [Desulfobulbaceae bacterium]|nr:methylmalonyl Co-A mutase-associated GTPase MeaB [Desulfobulbaceae bacterium]
MDTGDILQQIHNGDPRSIGRAISLLENHAACAGEILQGLDRSRIESSFVLGITGPPGAGKSTLTSRIVNRLRQQEQRVGIIAVDPSSPVSGGALLGDRIRMMDHARDRQVVVRSMATRGKLGGLCAAAGAAVRILAASGCETVIIETVGIGQSEMDIVRLADISVLVLAPGFGDEIQAMKAGILEVADLLVVNKADRPDAEKLVLHLGAALQNDAEQKPRLLQTVASENRGVNELVQRLQDMEKQYRLDGTLSRRRSRSAALETLDWTLELLRPRLKERIAGQEKGIDPRLEAEEIIRQLVGDRKK